MAGGSTFGSAQSLQRSEQEANTKTLVSCSNVRLSHAAQASVRSHRRRAPAQRRVISSVFWADSAHRDDRFDIPTTTGIPNNGGEGFRILCFPAFDG